MTSAHREITLVVAVAKNGVIGNDGGLPWRLPDDLKRFKQITLGKPVVMGRKTFESIGRPLAGRTNVVVTRNRGYRAAGCVVVHSLEDALAATVDVPEVCVIGGAELYTAALVLATRIELTEVDAAPDGDARFPPLARTGWREIAREPHGTDERHAHAFAFVTLVRANRVHGSG